MYVVTVTFQIQPGQMSSFLPPMVENARTSREVEPGCLQFDICHQEDEVFLYEVYADRAAFEAHLSSAHFQLFDAEVAGLIADKKIACYDGVIR